MERFWSGLQVRELEEKKHAELIRRVQTEGERFEAHSGNRSRSENGKRGVSGAVANGGHQTEEHSPSRAPGHSYFSRYETLGEYARRPAGACRRCAA